MRIQFEDGKAQMNGQEVSYSIDNDVVQIGDYDYEANSEWTELNNDSTDDVVGRYDLIDYNQNAVIDSVYVMFKDGEMESISDTMDDYTEKIKVDKDENGKMTSMTFHTNDGKEIVAKADMDIGGDEKVLGTSVTIDNKPAAIYDFNPLTYEFKAVVAEEDGKTSAYEFKRDDEDKFYLPKNVEYQGEPIDTDGVNEEWTQMAKDEFESVYGDTRKRESELDFIETGIQNDDVAISKDNGVPASLDISDEDETFRYTSEDALKMLSENDGEKHTDEKAEEGKVESGETKEPNGEGIKSGNDVEHKIDENDIEGKDSSAKDESVKETKEENKDVLPESLKEVASDKLKEEYTELKEKIEAYEKKPEFFRTDTDKANLMKEVTSFITKNFDTSEIRSMVIDKKDSQMNDNEKRYKDENVKVSTSEGGRERYYDVYKKDNDGNMTLDRREVWDNKEKYISRVENYREDARLDSVDYMNKAGQNYLTVNYGEKDVEGTPYEKVESVIERRFASDEKDAMLKSETEYGKGYKETTFFRNDGRVDKVMYLENLESQKGFSYVGKESYDKDGKVEKSEFNAGKIEKLIGNMESSSGISLGSEDKTRLGDVANGKSEDVLKDIKSICNGFDTSGNGAGISNDKIEYTKMITSVIDKLSETLKGVNGEKLPPREVERREDILQKLEFLRNNVFETKDDGKTYVEKFEKTRDVLESGISKGIKEFNEVLEETKSWMNDNAPDVSRTATASVDMGQRSSGGVDKESPNTMTMEKAISNYLERVESIKDNDVKADDSKYQGVKTAYEKYVEAKDQYKSNVEYINSIGLMANKDFFVQFDRLKVAIAERNLYMEAKANPDIAKEMGAIGFKDDGGYLRNIFTAALAVNNANPIDAIILRGVVSILDGLDPLTKTSVFEKEERPENMTKGDVLNSVMTDMANLDKDEYEKFEKDVSDIDKQENVEKEKQNDTDKDKPEDIEKDNTDDVEKKEENTDVENRDDLDKVADAVTLEEPKEEDNPEDVDKTENEDDGKVEKEEPDDSDTDKADIEEAERNDVDEKEDTKEKVESDEQKDNIDNETKEDDKVEKQDETSKDGEDLQEHKDVSKNETGDKNDKLDVEKGELTDKESNGNNPDDSVDTDRKDFSANDDGKDTEKSENKNEDDAVSKDDTEKKEDDEKDNPEKDGESVSKDEDVPDYVEYDTQDADVDEDGKEEQQDDTETRENEIILEKDDKNDDKDDVETEEKESDSDAKELYDKVKDDENDEKDNDKVEDRDSMRQEDDSPDVVIVTDENADTEEKQSDSIEVTKEEQQEKDEKENDIPPKDMEKIEVESDVKSDDEKIEKTDDTDVPNNMESETEPITKDEKIEQEDDTENTEISDNTFGYEETQEEPVEYRDEKEPIENKDENNLGGIGENDTAANDTKETESEDTKVEDSMERQEIPESISEMITDYINTDGGKNDNVVEFSDILNEIKDNGFKLEDDFVNIFANVFLDAISDGEIAAGDGVFSLMSHVADETGGSFLGLADQVAEALGEHGDLFYDSLAEGISLEYARPGEDSQDMAFRFGDMEYRIEMDGDHVDNILTIDTSTDADGIWGYPIDIGMDTLADAIHDICRDEIGLEFADNVTNVAASMVEMTNGAVDMDTALQMVVNDAADDVMAFGDAAMDESMYQQLGMEILQYESIDIPEKDIMNIEPATNDVDINQDSYHTNDYDRDEDSWNVGE